MCLFRKKKFKEKNIIADKEEVSKILTSLDICIHSAKDDVSNKKLEDIKHKMTYIRLSRDENAISIDKKILNKLDDIRSLLISNKSEEKLTNAINELEILIIKREGIK